MVDTLISDYEVTLKELTFNSKQIIDVLTTIADENKESAPGIVQVITNRIYKCIPEQKLYALYLLDSVCKTVGAPYNEMFGTEIFKIFSHIYLLVTAQTRAKLVKLFETWRILNARGTNLPLFPPEQLEKIGGFLSQAAPSPDAQNGISQKSQIATIDRLISILEEMANRNPTDSLNPQKLGALAALRQMLLSQVLGQSDLAGIQIKLDEMENQMEAQAQKLQGPPAQQARPKVSHRSPINSAIPEAPVIHKSPVEPQYGVRDAVMLFQDVISSGLVKIDQSLKKGSKPEYSLVIPKHKYFPQGQGPASFLSNIFQNANLSQLPQHEQIKYKEIVKIESKLGNKESYASDLQNFIANNKLDASTVQVLYEVKSLKCSLCGKRFPSDQNGATQKRLHLDWHFRINKRQANYKTNVQSRDWYLDTAGWIRFQENDISEFESNSAQKEGDTCEKAPEQSYVVIPSDETNMNNVCTICREHIKPSLNSTTDEWVWCDCVLAPGNNSGRKIMHTSCFEANRKRGAETESNPRIKRERYN